MTTTQVTDQEIIEAKQHLFIALDQLQPVLPKTHDDLIERMRDYFEGQRVDVFSKLVQTRGEAGFRDFIADTVVESGFYIRDDQGQVRVAKKR
jgi:hypothetical protein